MIDFKVRQIELVIAIYDRKVAVRTLLLLVSVNVSNMFE